MRHLKIKINHFEYFVSELLKLNNAPTNDFSILKVQKLLFFTVAIDSISNEKSKLIETIFDNFVAMPYGHVESDIYSAIRDNDLRFYIINSSCTINKKDFDEKQLNLNEDIKQVIDNALVQLKKVNPYIFNESPFNLVELSHRYKSWRMNFNVAKSKGAFSEPIKSTEIINEEKYFYLNQIELF